MSGFRTVPGDQAPWADVGAVDFDEVGHPTKRRVVMRTDF